MSEAAGSHTRAWGWIDHLTSGGTTEWRDWRAEGRPRSLLIPGAQHLEVVRRLNLLGPAPAGLVETVLRTSAPGKGQQHLDLVGLGAEPFGARPVDPSGVPADELLRVASGALADLALRSQPPARPAPRKRARVARLRTGYRLAGDPFLATAFRRQLREQGRPPGGRRPEVAYLLTDYGTFLADVWATQARRGNGLRWHRWLARLAADETLPERVDVLTRAARWAEGVGSDRVHPVFEPAEVARIAGASSLRPPVRLSHAALEVVRQTSTALRVDVESERRGRLLGRVLVPWLAGADDPSLPGPVVPRRYHGWLAREAARIRDSLVAAGYPVAKGSLDRLLPVEPVRTTGPDDNEVLGVMLRALHHAAGEPELKGEPQ